MTLQILRICRGRGPAEHPLLGIDHFHWLEWGTEHEGYYTLAELCRFVRDGGDVFMVAKSGRKLPVLCTKDDAGNRYVHTVVEGRETFDLLDLPDCSAG